MERTFGDDLESGGTLADQFAARRIGDRTMLPALEWDLEAARSGIDTGGGGFARMYGSFVFWCDSHKSGGMMEESFGDSTGPLPGLS